MLLTPEPAVLDVLRPGYRPLFGRVVAAVAGDERIRALWLGGSLASGTADAGSDLDLIVTVADDAFDDFARSWRAWLADVTPTVVARELPGAPGCFYSVTATCERLDVVAERASDVPTTAKHRVAVFDRDGLRDAVPPPRRESVLPARAAVTAAFLTAGREATATVGVAWPDALESAADAYFHAELGYGLTG